MSENEEDFIEKGAKALFALKFPDHCFSDWHDNVKNEYRRQAKAVIEAISKEKK